MEAACWTKKINLTAELKAHSRDFGFIQAMRILKLIDEENTEDDFQSFVRIRPELSLDFPRSDISNITINDDLSATIEATFLGLYGASSPLPTFYTEELLEEQRNGYSTSREFLDITNNTFYHLLFKIWSKYKLGISISENKNFHVENMLYSFVGLGHKKIREQIPHHYSLIKYAGLFIHNPRTSDGLKAIVMEHLNTDRVEIEECVLRSVKISHDQCLSLGHNSNSLGKNSYLGKYIDDVNGKFRIKVYLSDFNKFKSMLPGDTIYNQLKALVSFYISTNLEWDIEIILDPIVIVGTVLDAKTSRQLGYDSWLDGYNNKFGYNSILINPDYEERMRNVI